MRLAVTLLLAVTLFGADPAANALMQLDEQFCRDFAAKGVEGWLSHFAGDAIVFTPRGPIRHGMAEARKHYERVFGGRDGSLRWKPEGAFVAKSGDLGYTYGTYVSEGKDTDGKTVTSTGKYFTTWKKQKDGSWKIVADIGQQDLPPGP